MDDKLEIIKIAGRRYGILYRMQATRDLVRKLVCAAMIAAVFNSHLTRSRANETVDFARQIQPLLQAHCYECHNDATQKAELNLSNPSGIRKGSETGAIVTPGDPGNSRLYEVLHAGEMPPEDEGDPLSASQIELVRLWIQQGANTGSLGTQAPQLNQHDILPTLLLRCATCHGRQLQEGQLDLRTKASMLKGGKSGPAIVPGDPEASLMIQRIKAEEMPPRTKLASHSVKPVDETELKRLTKWIELGAPEIDIPRDVATTEPDPLVSDEDREFWSFQAPQQTPVPTLDREARNPIDAFIRQRLLAAELQPSLQADKPVLVRRAYFDLIGLPPSPEAIDSFVSNRTPDAYEQLIEQLLASPSYGERWGQYWLDLAGYSDSEGVQHSDPIRPHAYRYRDYVIRALNADKPYDRFLLEQIAGDELADYEHADAIDEELYDNLVATGFLRMTSDGTFAGITGFVPNRIDVIDDQIRVLSSAVMGISIRCARCHSHKFDPLPQRDYYRLVALFKPAMDEHDWLKPVTGGAGNSMGDFRYLPYVTSEERNSWTQNDEVLKTEIDQLKAQLEKQKDDEDAKKATEEKIQQLESERIPEPMIRALWDRGEPSPTYLLRRGDYLQPTRLVGPGVPSALTDGKTPFEPTPPWPGSKKTGNRLALARWLTQPEHPLTPRVIVNRIWKHHFGRGLVETLDDFGKAGAAPSHPELLDWLAVEFVRNGWSMKQLHRLIMNSATYRQRSDASTEHVQKDPTNRLLARMPLRRMEAEVLRDSILSIAGQLDLTSFGPADDVVARGDGLVVSKDSGHGQRRSIYVMKRRTQPLTILDSFDRPAMSPNCIDRPVSVVAPQALYLMNNKAVHQLSLSLADRVLAAVDGNTERIRYLFQVVVGRPPSIQEQTATLSTLQQMTDEWREKLLPDHETFQRTTDLDHQAQRNAFGNLCHAMINSAAFLYVD